MRSEGSILILDMVALRRRTDKKMKIGKDNKNGMRIPQSGNTGREPVSTCRQHQSDRFSRRNRERDARANRRDRRTVARALETLVNPTVDGTESRNTATLYSLQQWCETHQGMQENKGDPSAHSGAAPGRQQWVSCDHRTGINSTVGKLENHRKIEDGILLVVTARIYGHTLRALIDSGATRCFLSASVVKPLGLTTVKDYTFLELGDGQKILSKGKVLDIPIITAGVVSKMDLTITSLLHEVDLILGVSWLQAINPLIDWRSGRVYLPTDEGNSLLLGDWLDKTVQAGTVQVLQSADAIAALRDSQV